MRELEEGAVKELTVTTERELRMEAVRFFWFWFGFKMDYMEEGSYPN